MALELLNPGGVLVGYESFNFVDPGRLFSGGGGAPACVWLVLLFEKVDEFRVFAVLLDLTVKTENSLLLVPALDAQADAQGLQGAF